MSGPQPNVDSLFISRGFLGCGFTNICYDAIKNSEVLMIEKRPWKK